MAANKMTINETPPAVSAAELAQALVEALQQSASVRGEITGVPPGSKAQDAIEKYQRIAADLETLPLKR